MRELLADVNYVNLALTQTIRHQYREATYGLNIWSQIVRSYVDIRTRLEKLRKKYQIQMIIVAELHDNLDVHYHGIVTMKKTNKIYFERAYKKLFDEIGNYKLKNIPKLDGWLDYLLKVDNKPILEYTPLKTKVLLDTYGLYDTDDLLEDRYQFFTDFVNNADDNEQEMPNLNALKYYFDTRGLEKEYEERMDEKIHKLNEELNN